MPRRSILMLAAALVALPMFSRADDAPARPAADATAAVDAPAVNTPAAPEIKSGTVGPGVPHFFVRSGYHVSIVADNLPEARFIELDDKGNLFVSQPGRGSITKLSKPDADGKYTTRSTYISGKPSAHGLCFANGYLWFTQSGAVYKAKEKEDGTPDVTTVIPEGQLPQGGGHWWRSICVTDKYFFTSIGDDGNLNDHYSNPNDPNIEREKIWRFDLDGQNKTLWSSGIRNTEKLRFKPGTNDLYGCDHGSDNFGGQDLKEKGGTHRDDDGNALSNQPETDFNPPCEFNKYIQGGFYGHPFVVGNRLVRSEYRNRPDILELCAKTIVPEWPIGGHFAPNGWNFCQSDALGFKGDALIACHGSWNSATKVGYQIRRILFDPETGHPYGALSIVGTLDPKDPDPKKQVLARPVDVVEAPDGSVLFSSDDPGNARKIFRITREK